MFVTLDKFGQTVLNSAFAVVILGNVLSRDYELIALDKLPLSEDIRLNFTRRNFEFLGVVALREGRPISAFAHDFDAETVSLLARKFLNHVERELNAQVAKQVGDSLEWLQRLQALPDLRSGMEN